MVTFRTRVPAGLLAVGLLAGCPLTETYPPAVPVAEEYRHPSPVAIPAPPPPPVVEEPIGGFECRPITTRLRQRRAGPLCQDRGQFDHTLGAPEVAYAHLRNAEAGCFMARVERVSAPGASGRA